MNKGKTKQRNFFNILKEQKDVIATILTIVSILIVSFLVSNFIFNLGYFSWSSYKFLELLTLSDYQEGTAPLLFFVCVTFILFFNVLHIDLLQFVFIKDLVYCSYKIFIVLPLQYVFIFISKSFIKLFLLKNMNYTIKKRYIILSQKFVSTQSKYKKIKSKFIDVCIKILLLLIYAICPIWTFYNKVYCVEPLLFWSILKFWLIFIILIPFIKEKYKYLVVIPILFIVLFISGQWMFLRNLQDTSVINYTMENRQLHVVRILSRGVIVYDKKSDNLTFVTWESVKSISKEIKYAKKRYFTNAK